MPSPSDNAIAMPIWRRLLLRTMKYALIGLCCYLGVLFVIWILENRLIYYPTSANDVWESAPSDDFEDVWLQTANGTKIHGWWHPQPKSEGALIVFHGNAGNLSQRGGVVAAMRDHFHMSVLIIDYPGYGKSDGKPSEKGCYAAADAAYEWLIKKPNQPIAPKKIVIYGDSLGGGVAVDLASRKTHRALILIRTFTSIPDTAKHHYWWLPAHWIMRNRFNNLKKIAQCESPIFIAHGTADTLIPYSQGKKLFEAAPGHKAFLPMPDADHNDPLPQELWDKAKMFLEQTKTRHVSAPSLVG